MLNGKIGKNRKKEHHYQILHIQYKLETKFQLQLEVLSF